MLTYHMINQARQDKGMENVSVNTNIYILKSMALYTLAELINLIIFKMYFTKINLLNKRYYF